MLCGVVCTILCIAIFDTIQMDGQTDGRTNRHIGPTLRDQRLRGKKLLTTRVSRLAMKANFFANLLWNKKKTMGEKDQLACYSVLVIL